MYRPRCRDRALRRANQKTVAACFAFDLDRAAPLVGDAVKRDEAIALPLLGALGLLAVHPHAEHAYLEMRLRLNGDAVPARLDRVGIGADLAKRRMRHTVDELSRRLRNAGGHGTNEN